jgi:hypothetical protein
VALPITSTRARIFSLRRRRQRSNSVGLSPSAQHGAIHSRYYYGDDGG